MFILLGRLMRSFCLFISAILILSMPFQGQQRSADPSKPTFPGRRSIDYAPKAILVRYRSAAPEERVTSTGTRNVKVAATFRTIPELRLLQLPAELSVAEALRRYRQDPNVLYAEPDYTVWVSDKTPNDPKFSLDWGLHNTGLNGGIPGSDINAIKAWDLSTGDSGVVVGIIDSGVQWGHPDLAANLLAPVTRLPDGTGPDDVVGHGTHVAGTIGAVGNNAVGVAGVNWTISMLPCKFIGPDGSGPVSAAIACLDYLAQEKDAGLNLIATNNSWGGIAYSQALYDAIKAHEQRGILFIAAAGNGDAYGHGLDNDEAPHYPASYDLDNIISVAATDRTDRLASFSDFGRHSVHVGAPGVAILSTVPDWTGGYDTYSGTSMATPHVTGAAALLKAWNPNLSWWQIRNLLIAGGDQVSALQNTITGNRLDLYGAMTCSGRTVQHRLMPRRNTMTTTDGKTIILKMLNIDCDQPAGSVSVIGPDGSSIVLHDDGQSGDDVAGDGIYTAEWVVPGNGTYAFTFPGNDVVTIKAVKAYDFTAQPQGSYVSITGTNLDISDETVGTFDSPFPFQFGGQLFTRVYVSDNGYLSLDQQFSFSLPFLIPADTFSSVIAPFWDDLNPIYPTANNIFWGVAGTAPNRQLVVEWRQVPHFPYDATTGGTATFEVVFNESKDDILFNYKDVYFGGYNAFFIDQGTSASVGLQIDGEWGKLYSYYQRSLTNGLSILWTSRDPDFSLDLQPPLQTVYSSQQASFSATLTSLYAFNAQVNVTCQVQTPATCQGGTILPSQQGESLNLTASSLTPGKYPISVQAQGPGSNPLTRSGNAELDVVDFDLGSPSSSSLTIPDGTSSTLSVPVSFLGPMTSPVTLACANLPSGASCGFAPSNVVQPSTTPVSIAVTIQLAQKTPAGNYVIDVNAIAPGAPYSRSQSVPLTVTLNPDFFLSSASSVIYGTNAVGNVTVDLQDSYTGTVQLNCAVVPPGPNCSFSPASVSVGPQSATSTLNISLGSAAAGNYAVTITGNDGKRSHDLKLTYSAADFAGTVPNAVVYSGTLNYVPVTITGFNGYTGTVIVSCDVSNLAPNAFCLQNQVYMGGGMSTWAGTVFISPGLSTTWSGSYPVTFTFSDTGNNIFHTATAMVTPQGFTWNANDGTPIPLYPGQVSDPIPYTLTPINGFNLPVALAANCGGCVMTPATVTPSGQPIEVDLTLTAGAPLDNPQFSYTGEIDITASASVNLGAYPIWVTAPTETTIYLKDFVPTVPQFKTVFDQQLILVPGFSGSINVNYVSLHGFDKPFDVSCPAVIGPGIHCTADKTHLAPGDSATFTFSADAGTPSSHRTVTIEADATVDDIRQIQHTVSFPLIVTDLNLTLTPPSIKVPAGGDAYFEVDAIGDDSYTITKTASLSCVSQDPGVACDAPQTIQIPGSANVHLTTTDGVSAVGPHNFALTAVIDASSVTATGTIVMQGPDSLTVTSPNGGELWASGIQAITWNYAGNPGDTVKIELVKNGTVDRLIADNVSVGTGGKGAYSWSMPDPLPFSQHYQVRVTSDTRPDITDDSRARVWMGKGLDFNKVSIQSLVNPRDYIVADYAWAGNSSIDFDLYKGGKFLKQLSHGLQSGYNGPCWCWDVYGNTGADTPPGNDYTVVGTPAGDPSEAVTSQPFAIGNEAITFTYPKGGEIWRPGETQTIQWNWVANYIQPGKDVSLSIGGYYGQRLITLSTDLGPNGQGSYTFIVPSDFPAGVGYQITASTYGVNSMSGQSGMIAVGDYHNVNIHFIGAGGEVASKDGQVICYSDCTHLYTSGTTITLQSRAGGFNGWSGPCSGTGDCTFTVTQDVTVTANFTPDIAFSMSGPAPSPIKAGSSAQVQVSLTSTPGVTSPATLACSGLPNGAWCTFDQNNIAPSQSPTLVNVTIHTTGAAVAQITPPRLTGWFVVLCFAAFGLVVRTRRQLLICFALVACLGMTSCGGGGSSGGGGGGGGGGSNGNTPPGTYQITVTATAGTITHAVTIPITVQ